MDSLRWLMCRIEYLLALSFAEVAHGEELLSLPLDLMRSLLAHEALRQAPGDWGAANELALLEGLLRYALDSPQCASPDAFISLGGGTGCTEAEATTGALDVREWSETR